jgi:hypothetical protein
MTDIKLGKIQSVEFGFGGYQDAQVGISFTLSGRGWGVTDFWGYWSMERSEYAKWTEDDRTQYFGRMVLRIAKLLEDAKKQNLTELKGSPVEITFDAPFGKLISWRILTEVT